MGLRNRELNFSFASLRVALMLCLASLGGLLPDDRERLYDVAWDAEPKQMIVARSMPETAAQGKVPSWDVTHSKEMAPTALHLMQQSIATNADDAMHNLVSLPKQKPAGEVLCDLGGCPNDSLGMVERRGPHELHRAVAMVAARSTVAAAMPERQSEEQLTGRPRLAMPEVAVGAAEDADGAGDEVAVGRSRHALLRRLALRLEVHHTVNYTMHDAVHCTRHCTGHCTRHCTAHCTGHCIT